MKIIVALSKHNGGIGYNNNIPWFIKEDLVHFKNITCYNQTNNEKSKNVVVMGRKTWESIPEKNKPLKNRINIILTHNKNQEFINSINKYNNSSNIVLIKDNFNDIIELNRMNKVHNTGNIFIIGGSQIYKQALDSGCVEDIIVTEIYNKYICDIYFPKIKDNFKITSVSKFFKSDTNHYRFIRYSNIQINKNICAWENTEELSYLKLMSKIINEGIETSDRTNVGTFSVFGEKLEYNLEDTFPALTTKKIFFKGIIEELLLYISGKTDNTILNDKNIHIWDGNTTREFLDKRNLHMYPINDMGETYGFNFRHYGADYVNCKMDYSGAGFDQLQNAIDLIRTDPNSRRIIINLWNPATNYKAALPSCLCFYQFYVDTKNHKLNLQIYIRSSDFFLANNWNTLTGALLVHMICNLKDINLTPGKLSVITGDTHIYKTHIEQVKENLTRSPRPFPKLVIGEPKDKIEEYSLKDFKLYGYYPDKNISATMAV